MHDWDLHKSIVLSEWAQTECQHLDLIASWESLLGTYEALGFSDQIPDEKKLAEFKLVIGELNKFLTRMKKGLDTAQDVESAIEFLGSHANTAEMNAVKTRSNIAYNKLKQRWIMQAISALEIALPDEDDEGEEADDR